MTGRFVLSPRVQTDLDDIWDYTADRWGLDQAETCTRDIWQRCRGVRRLAHGLFEGVLSASRCPHAIPPTWIEIEHEGSCFPHGYEVWLGVGVYFGMVYPLSPVIKRMPPPNLR
jgi:hypothetical protein